MQIILYVFVFWLVSFILGLAALPWVKKWAMARGLGLIIVSFILFFGASLWLIPLGFWSILGILVAVGLFCWWKFPRPKFNREFLVDEIIFAGLFLFIILVKSFSPEIYQIERFMDFGFMKILSNSKFLPVEDLWMSGKSLNYYYFGHFMGYVLVTLSRVPMEVGFYLVVAWIFATVGLLVYRLSGFIGVFLVLFAGNWHTLWQIFSGKNFWYAEVTRSITGTITEMPIYSFIVAELHAHVWGLLNGAIILTLLYSIWNDKNNDIKKFIIVGFMLGIAMMTNTWDAITLGGLTGLVMIRKIKYLGVVGLTALFTVLPWFYFFKSPVGSIGIVKQQSSSLFWILFWGPLIIFGIKALFKKDFYSLVVIWAFILLAGIEIFYIQDVLKDGEWFRANTVFKVTTQVWLWLGIVGGVVAKNIDKKICLIGLICLIGSMSIYPVKAIYQSSLENKKFMGIGSGLDWWKNKFPYDYMAYLYLKNISGKHVILEAEGESYTDTSRYSVFLGWPTVAGWSVHEWTWRGSYLPIGDRGMEVREVYLGSDLEKAKDILTKYHVNYIVVGQVERQKYKNTVNLKKIGDLAYIVYQNPETTVYLVKDYNPKQF